MGDKRESLKKSLGITEYPWSSDDEPNDIEVQPMSSIQSMPTEHPEPHHSVGEMPGTSAAHPPTASSPQASRSHGQSNNTRDDPVSIWTLLSNPMFSGSRPINRPNGPRSAPAAANFYTSREAINEWARRDMKRVVAYRKFRNNRLRTLYSALAERGNSVLYASPSGGQGERSDSRRHRVYSTHHTNDVMPTLMGERTRGGNSDADVTDAPEPINVDHSDEEEESPEVSSENLMQQMQADDAAQARQEHAEAVSRHSAGAAAAPSAPSPPPRESHQPEPDADSVLEGNEPNSVKEFNQSLLRLLECPVCLEWMEPPMSQCRRGHLVCSRCRTRLNACPVCRTSFSSVRNRAMEGVAEMLRYPCRHGCGRETRLRRRGVHEASCPARRYRCIAPECARADHMPRQALHHHMQSKHLSMLKMGRKHRFATKLNGERRENWLVMCMNEMFHLKIDVDIRTWTLVVYVAYVGPKCNAGFFTYEVTILGQDSSRKLSYIRATHCDLESTSLNVGRQDCFHMSIDQALNFLRVKNRNCLTDQLLHFNVVLGRVNETAREDSDTGT